MTARIFDIRNHPKFRMKQFTPMEDIIIDRLVTKMLEEDKRERDKSPYEQYCMYIDRNKELVVLKDEEKE